MLITEQISLIRYDAGTFGQPHAAEANLSGRTKNGKLLFASTVKAIPITPRPSNASVAALRNTDHLIRILLRWSGGFAANVLQGTSSYSLDMHHGERSGFDIGSDQGSESLTAGVTCDKQERGIGGFSHVCENNLLVLSSGVIG